MPEWAREMDDGTTGRWTRRRLLAGSAVGALGVLGVPQLSENTKASTRAGGRADTPVQTEFEWRDENGPGDRRYTSADAGPVEEPTEDWHHGGVKNAFMTCTSDEQERVLAGLDDGRVMHFEGISDHDYGRTLHELPEKIMGTLDLGARYLFAADDGSSVARMDATRSDSLVWERTFTEPVSDVASWSGRVFVSLKDGTPFEVDLDSGATVNEFAFPYSSQPLHVDLVAADGALYASYQKLGVVKYDLGDGEREWGQEFDRWKPYLFSVADAGVVTWEYDDQTSAFSLLDDGTGSEKWTHEFETSHSTTPVLANDRLIYGYYETIAISLADGSVDWQADLKPNTMVCTEDRLYVARHSNSKEDDDDDTSNQHNDVIRTDVNTGAQRWQYTPRYDSYVSFMIPTPTGLLLSGDAGTTHVVDETQERTTTRAATSTTTTPERRRPPRRLQRQRRVRRPPSSQTLQRPAATRTTPEMPPVPRTKRAPTRPTLPRTRATPRRRLGRQDSAH